MDGFACTCTCTQAGGENKILPLVGATGADKSGADKSGGGGGGSSGDRRQQQQQPQPRRQDVKLQQQQRRPSASQAGEARPGAGTGAGQTLRWVLSA